jgi:hypothetical protein
MFNRSEIKCFIHEGHEYWDSIPHSRGTLCPSSYLKIVNGSLYQWWPSYKNVVEKYDGRGIWIKVPNVTTNENKESQKDSQEDYHGEGS